jgi:membrane-associated protease RseP (regulator of RpoE activity)
MRALIGVLALGAAVTTLQAQTKVTTGKQQDTSVRILERRGSSTDQIRELKVTIAELVARAQTLGLQMFAARDDASRRLAVQAELENVLNRKMFSERKLRMECAAARPDEDIPGTIGIEVDSTSGIFWIRQLDAPGRESLTMFFGAKPPRVRAVATGSPAAKAGVRVGDTWVSVNGKQLMDSVRLDELLNPGSTVVLRVSRSGRQMELPPVQVARKGTAGLADYPAEVCDSALHFEVSPVPLVEFQLPVISLPRAAVRPVTPRASSSDPWDMRIFVTGPTSVRYAGMTLEALDDAWRETVGVQGDGVGVKDVVPGTPAAIAGLRKFDVIRQVNGETVGSPAAFQRIANEQRTLVLVVFNKGLGTTRPVTLSANDR